MPRLFAALPLPEPIREALLDPMEALPGARWQDADNLHVTLRFIGEVHARDAGDVMLALSRVAFAPFALRIAGVGHFERKNRATAVWARLAPSDDLGMLHQQAEAACQRAGLAAETRKFTPHVTLARLNSASGPIAPWLARHGDLALGPWTVDRFCLFESHLSRAGSTYEEIASFPANR